MKSVTTLGPNERCAASAGSGVDPGFYMSDLHQLN